MSMSTMEINLSRHVIMKDNFDKVMVSSNGCLLLWDKMKNVMLEIPDVPQIRQCFGIEPKLEKSPEKSVSDTDTNMLSGEIPTVCNSDTNMLADEIPTCDEKKTTAFWKDENAVKTLIYQWKQHQPLFESSVIRNDVVWTKISEELKKANSVWQYTAKNCENKFKDITKVYKRTKDHNNQTGVEPKTCKYFEELEEVLGEKPCLKPVALASNLKKRSHLAAFSSESSNTDNITDVDDKEDKEISRKSKKPKTRMERDLEIWSRTMSEENKKRDDARERRHQELLAHQERARETFVHLMGKFLEKL